MYYLQLLTKATQVVNAAVLTARENVTNKHTKYIVLIKTNNKFIDCNKQICDQWH